ncbi:hypothetical protein MED121_06445 [Marinomonas sp. MED121]|jgi:hypothetical protein|uniref:DUF1801 domain-containing protein n=1 Tax=Marinomonas sp. MED121 TaxID=314277 RepID=UPI000069038B|nr:DUF1801 domain-containing protein [Marinomonas sp. MED121]EAQ66300.1 hypothetical protein MED121_06445 [Marinomonas sp. MED121]
MQELPPSVILQDYLDKLPIQVQDDFQEIVSLMSLIAPDATLSFKSGIPLFEIDHEGLFGLAARPGYISLYIPDSELLTHFAERLLPAQIGSDCFHFQNLDKMNLNVIAELLGRVKSDLVHKIQHKKIHLH